MEADIAAANAKVPAVGADIKISEEQNARLEEGTQQAQTDCRDAKTALSDPTALSEKEASAFAALEASPDANITEIIGAVAALENGIAGSFLQTPIGQVFRKLIPTKATTYYIDWREILSFFGNGQNSGYLSQSEEVVEILKEI